MRYFDFLQQVVFPTLRFSPLNSIPPLKYLQQAVFPYLKEEISSSCEGAVAPALRRVDN